MRCPTCGAPVMARKDSWECGYCCDCGSLPSPGIVLTADVEEEPKLTVESLAENADPDTALLGGNPLPRKKWEIPYQSFKALCAARSREAAEQENTEKTPNAEKKAVL